MHLLRVVLASFCVVLTSSGSGWAQSAGATVGWRSDSLRIADNWNTFTTDMRVTRRHVKTNGQALGALVPDASYRLERSNRTGNWKTVTTVVSMAQAPQTMLSAATVPPRAVSVTRLEDDEDGTPVRAYDAQGRQLRDFHQTGATQTMASAVAVASPPRSFDRAWINSMVATKAQKAARLLAYERRFGPPVTAPTSSPTNADGTGGRRKVYTRHTGDTVQQLITDGSLGVPLEFIETRANVQAVRQTFSYGTTPDGVVRVGSRSEIRLSPEIDEVLVVDTTYSNIRLERR